MKRHFEVKVPMFITVYAETEEEARATAADIIEGSRIDDPDGENPRMIAAGYAPDDMSVVDLGEIVGPDDEECADPERLHEQ